MSKPLSPPWSRPAILAILFGLTTIYSCHSKKVPATDTSQPTASTPMNTDSLFSVANLQHSTDSSTVEVWFYESARVFTISATAPGANESIDILNYAKANQVPVNVRLAVGSNNRIAIVTPSTEEQRTRFKAEAAKKEKALPVKPPGQ